MKSWEKNRTCRKSLGGGWELNRAGGGRQRLLSTFPTQGDKTRGSVLL